MLMMELTPFFMTVALEEDEEYWDDTSRLFSGVSGNLGMTGLLLGGVERNDFRREWLNALPGFL